MNTTISDYTLALATDTDNQIVAVVIGLDAFVNEDARTLGATCKTASLSASDLVLHCGTGTLTLKSIDDTIRSTLASNQTPLVGLYDGEEIEISLVP